MASNWDFRAVVSEAQRLAPDGTNPFFELIRMITDAFVKQSGKVFTKEDTSNLNYFGVGKEIVLEYLGVYFEIDLTPGGEFKFVPVSGSLKELYQARLENLKHLAEGPLAEKIEIPVGSKSNTNKKLVN